MRNAIESRPYTPVAVAERGRAAAGQKKERSDLQSACDELTDKGAFITDE
jgi:hypothetical protein